MCGIAGCFGGHDIETVTQMLDALPHRGPDDRGIHVHGTAVLGHTRLSIVDVAKGHQPILSKDKKSGIICNGEIYNFEAIRNRLATRYTFTTQSDSESVLHLFRDKGPECVFDLDGMFAFAVFNGEDFMLARDPIGIKPLYYGFRDHRLYFSSELGAMSHAGVVDVHEFPCGHYYTPDKGFIQYYEVPRVQDYFLSDMDDTAALVRHTLIRAIRKRLLSDRKIHVGSFCSGGLDSSLIAAVAAEDIPHLHTFAVGMRDASGNESDDLVASRMAAAHIGSTHHETVFTETDYYDALPEVIRKLETYDPSLVRCAAPCYFTCKAAAEHVTVVLTGEGADEVFAGYQYMKHLEPDNINREVRRLIQSVHNINLQRADRMGMLFSLELRVPFFDAALIDLGMKIAPDLKIRRENGKQVEKWILRKAFSGTGLLPEEILWRDKVQYTQGAGCESLGERLAEAELSDDDFERIRAAHPDAVINSKEAAYYFTLFRRYHPQKSILKSIGIWPGFDFPEERRRVRGTVRPTAS
ncbi:MAG: asparagine synthase B [Deltaproteobacteria bacterium]|nr:asparagine synthase B [Deltaproteobacteria bacterium]MBW1954291.1 asparagine synthase B [Deltaproteobacteria bacterium]MBW2042102.1 asparagine synthase B [Deltaproteobacteria bacterium]MBW2132595.1 asparagine synthase B [Deltaproteobacteria bacterium]